MGFDLQSVKSPHDFSEQLLKEAGEYNGFNLIVADLCSMTMLYITNRPKESGMSVTEVSPGIHVLSNATVDSPWPKVTNSFASSWIFFLRLCQAILYF